MKYLINQKTVKNIKKKLVLIWFVVGDLVNYIRNEESLMNQKLKQAGLFAILAVFTMSLTTSLVVDAQASKVPEGAGVEPSVKAQHMAQLLERLNVENSPSLIQISVHDPATKPGTDFVVTGDVKTFRATYTLVNPVTIDVRNVEILVTSDTESVKGEFDDKIRNYDIKRSIISVNIDAVDPASINAKIIGL